MFGANSHMNTKAAAAYVARVCVHRSRLAGVAPQPTYRIYVDGVASAIATCGFTDLGASEAFFGPAVISWLRRAVLVPERPADAGLCGAPSLGEIAQPSLVVCGDLDFSHIQERCRLPRKVMPGSASDRERGGPSAEP